MRNPNEQFTSFHPGCSRLARYLTALVLIYSFAYVLSGCSSSSSSKPVLPTAASLPSSCTAATVGSNYSCSITVAGGKAPFKWTVTGLPAGLTDSVSADTKTLTISGTPQAQHAVGSAYTPETRVPAIAPVNISVTATDASGKTSSITFNIAITIVGLGISTTSLPNGTVGMAYSASVSASGGVTPYTWTITGLPRGLTSTGPTISGTPTQSGTFTITVKVTDSETPATSAQTTLSLTIAPATAALAISTTSLPGGTAGMAYSTSVTATGGTTPYTWVITGLPSGITPTSGTPSATISGTTDSVGSFSVIAKVTDSASTPASVSVTFSLTIAQAATLMISTTSLPNGTQNASYSQTLAATAGVKPYTWTEASGTLPTGLTLSAEGVISGTPTATGSFSFTVKVTDSESPAQSAMQALSITINGTSNGLNITTASPLPGATLGSAYNAMVTATGGTPPYTFSVPAGSTLPAGLSLTSGSPSATMSGTPTATGTFQFTIDVKDSAGTPATASASFLITVTGSSTLNCPATVNLTVCGTYVAGIRGFNRSGGPTALGVVFTANSSGNVISGEGKSNDSANGVTSITITGGSVAMDSSGDGRGLLILIDSTGKARTFRFVLESTANAGAGPIEEFDSSGTLAEGSIFGPETTPVAKFQANIAISMQLDGVNGAGQRVGLLGNFEIGPTGCDGSAGSFNSQTGEPVVINSGGAANTSLTITGSCSTIDSNGFGNATLTIAGGTPFTNNTLHFTYVDVAGMAALILETDALGTNQPILSGLSQPAIAPGSITPTIAASQSPLLLVEGGTTTGTVSGLNIATIVQVNLTASGSASGVLDQNAGGSIITQGTWPYTAFAVDANGVGTITGPSQKTIHFIIDTNGVLGILDESANVIVGNMRKQNSTSIESPGAPYIFGRHLADLGQAQTTVHAVGVLVPSGATSGTLSGTLDVISSAGSFSGVAASGTYNAIDSTTGRGTGTADLTNGSTVNVVIHALRHRQFLILDMQTSNPFVFGARLQ